MKTGGLLDVMKRGEEGQHQCSNNVQDDRKASRSDECAQYKKEHFIHSGFRFSLANETESGDGRGRQKLRTQCHPPTNSRVERCFHDFQQRDTPCSVRDTMGDEGKKEEHERQGSGENGKYKKGASTPAQASNQPTSRTAGNAAPVSQHPARNEHILCLAASPALLLLR